MRLALRAAGMHGRGLRNALRIQLRHDDVELHRLPPAFEAYTLLQLGDLHLDMNPALLGALIEHISGLEYAACVMTGDFRYRTCGHLEPSMTALARLVAHLKGPAYAVLGNHDSIRTVPHIEDLGVRVLLNESVAVARAGDSLLLAGIDDAHYFRRHSLHKAAHEIPRVACVVLLSHTPEPHRHAAHAEFSLMLSGHTHGGQICLPGGIPVLTDCAAPRRAHTRAGHGGITNSSATPRSVALRRSSTCGSTACRK
jgi:predicted MPP superfamily phosphohydrolase